MSFNFTFLSCYSGIKYNIQSSNATLHHSRKMVVVFCLTVQYLLCIDQAFIISTTAFLAAGRFGLAPTAKLHTKAGTKLYEDDSEGLTTGDPGGAH